jgi:inner membrane transporter RhtA
MLGHRIAREGGTKGIDRLGASMMVAMAAAVPIGIWDAIPAFKDPLLPATATVIGILVLHQVPSIAELAGVGLVILGVGIHREAR